MTQGPDKQNEAMHLLRKAASLLDGMTKHVIFPGWDMASEYAPRRKSIRQSARAIAADGLTCDQGVRVAFGDLGMLVQYIGDMLET